MKNNCADFKIIYFLGHLNDAGIFNHSELGIALKYNLLNFPNSQPLPGTNFSLPFYFIGDGAFGLRPNVMTPYVKANNLSGPEQVFNERLSSARKVIECAFGILVQRWRILQFPINFMLATNEYLSTALMCIHNFLITTELTLENSERRYSNYDERGEIENNIVIDDSDQVNVNGIMVRNTLTEYLSSEEGRYH